jgi:hypothetical protein
MEQLGQIKWKYSDPPRRIRSISVTVKLQLRMAGGPATGKSASRSLVSESVFMNFAE